MISFIADTGHMPARLSKERCVASFAWSRVLNKYFLWKRKVNGCKINHILNKYDVVYEMKCDFICVSLYHPLSFEFCVIVGRKRRITCFSCSPARLLLSESVHFGICHCLREVKPVLL